MKGTWPPLTAVAAAAAVAKLGCTLCVFVLEGEPARGCVCTSVLLVGRGTCAACVCAAALPAAEGVCAVCARSSLTRMLHAQAGGSCTCGRSRAVSISTA